MNKRTKIKIIKKALKLHKFNYQSFTGNIWELPELVEEDPTEFIETCVEEAYKEGLNSKK